MTDLERAQKTVRRLAVLAENPGSISSTQAAAHNCLLLLISAPPSDLQGDLAHA